MEEENIVLKHSQVPDAQKYLLLREEKNVLNGLGNENFIEAVVETKKLVNPGNPSENIFSVLINNYKQSNATGMYGWAGELSGLKKNLIIQTGEQGELAAVKNMGMLRQEWAAMRLPLIQKKKNEKMTPFITDGVTEILNDEERLCGMLMYSCPYLNLFPPLRNKPLSARQKAAGYRELHNVLHIKKVPLVTGEYILKEPAKKDRSTEVMVEGELDEKAFEEDQLKLTEMLHMIKKRPRVPTIARVKYTERYRFNGQGGIDQSMCVSLLEVPGSIHRYEKTILKRIPYDREEAAFEQGKHKR